ncbi:2-polyprenyl-6-methoxyphenol hydroxylase-like FAD-dependent oxidoreductase [Bradyrhizobium sp. CIR48]|uniref:FAD-dependent oxidoreductase n=1 Tax=unclassified Bradyrhizobium TaxID=2631580 RepID=UPI001606EDE7|nr:MULTISPECIES: NAD(P)/FAD-dependent oxidoreductase [unclassified Bradyrhizobium]MBB4360661.1 2-polyprenyl-6-methoxyphenol hydroxylase-like FAD-dependent oxidoreductase [Bradyrhizobium sp. CIR18]MBB4429574.1 2-polyprenyl-6-methoxyphenol hydroxylase-like FAD-dependent oxidoreductase [Bradyrhizobium sp. CIR48]
MTKKSASNVHLLGASSSLLNDKKIAIIGAGPCGLTLARLLQQKGADVRVFEMEPSSTARNQGGSLDLHEDSGQLALRRAGLHEEFLAACRPEGQAIKIVDKHGKMIVDLQPKDEAETRPEIDRAVLRSLLIDSLDAETIQWGRPLENVERSAQGNLRLVFADGRHVDADLVFGCDGAWSKVRPFVSTTKPYYCGITIAETWIPLVEAHHPRVAELVGAGIFLATGDDKGLLAQRNGNGSVRVYVLLRVPEDWTQRCGFAFNQLDATRQGLLQIFEGWAPHLREVLTIPDMFIPRSLYTHPPRQAAWLDRANVTLLGDAAHVMPFFTGRGVNLAMLDAAELADNLTSEKFSDVAGAIRAYETSMFDRMAPEISENHADQDVFISRDAPAGIKELLWRRIELGQERKAKPSSAGSNS